MIRILPNDIYPEETAVIVEGKGNGVISHHKIEKDQHNKPITVHYVTLENTGKCVPVNYSFLIIKCTHCKKPATKYLMHQALCDTCGKEFTELHKQFC